MAQENESLKGRYSTDIVSLTQFVDEVTKLTAGTGPKYWWYRGHGKVVENESLLPGALRKEFHGSQAPDRIDDDPDRRTYENAEKELIEEFRREAAYLLPPDASLVEIYFTAQHHELPTRLLDWTANPLAALFFAVATRRNDDGEVIVLQPDWYLTFGKNGRPSGTELPWPPVSQRDPLVVEAVKALFGQAAESIPPLIIPIRPDSRLRRVFQQDSRFTLHTRGCPNIQELDTHVRRYRIPKDAKQKLITDLDTMAINWATLFPDLDYVALQLKVRRGIGMA